jgi:hypothetical protein
MTFKHGVPPYSVAPDRRCKAKSKQTGERCKQLAVAGREVCHWHGGASLSGRQHPGYRHGEHSKRGRAELAYVNRLGKALEKLEKAATQREIREAVEFTRHALASEPKST